MAKLLLSLPAHPLPRDGVTFLLVRHGQSEANAGGETEQDTDSPLTELGQQQAQRLALALQGVTLTAIHSSDLRRAQATVAPLAAAQGLGVQFTPLLREPRSSRRATQFVDPTQAAALLASLPLAPATPAPPAPPETHVEVVARLRAFLGGLQSAAGSVVVLCTHYVTLNVLVRLLVDPREPPASLWAHFDNGSVTRVDVPAHRQPPTGSLMFLNWKPPLEPL